MAKAFAFISFGLNAGMMLGIALLLAKSLTPAEYSRYSFGVATAQTLAVFVFEWVRMAAVRHYPGPIPEKSPGLRSAFLGGQYVLGCCTILASMAVALTTSDSYWFLIALYAVASGAVDLQFIMLRFDSQLSLFSKLQTFRGIASLVIVVSAAYFLKQGSAALIGAILSNALTIAMLAFVRPGFVFVVPSLGHIVTLRQVASYGVLVAIAGGLYQAGPFFLRCVAFRGSSDVSYAGFSLVVDLLQRPFNLLLDASNGVFFPDAVREHDVSDNPEGPALRLLYAIHAWCLLMTFGCSMAFRNEVMALLVKPELLPYVLNVFPFLSVLFLIHVANNYTCAISLILNSAAFKLMLQAATEFVSIVTSVGLWTTVFGLGAESVALGGLIGAAVGFVLTSGGWRAVRCRLPWKSWGIAFVTALPLVLIGTTEVTDRVLGVFLKVLIASPVIFVGGIFGLAIPFGFLTRLKRRAS